MLIFIIYIYISPLSHHSHVILFPQPVARGAEAGYQAPLSRCTGPAGVETSVTIEIFHGRFTNENWYNTHNSWLRWLKPPTSHNIGIIMYNGTIIGK